MYTRCTQNEQGFTFVETLVAVSILLLAIVAPLSLAYQSLSASRIARNQVTAIYLAQEAVEYIRAARDGNTLSGLSWLSGLSACVVSGFSGGYGCTIDVVENDIVACSAEGCKELSYDDQTFVYGYASGEESGFTRTVIITESEIDREARVDVSVSWRDGSTLRSVSVDQHIFNWQ